MPRKLNNDGKQRDSYVEKLFKLIPAEISGAYLAISSLLDPTNEESDINLLIAFLILLALLPIYMMRVLGVREAKQIFITFLSFPLWAANVSSIQVSENFGLSSTILGIALILWTVMIPIIFGKNED